MKALWLSLVVIVGAGCNVQVTPAPNCHDGIMNGDEMGVDCGPSCPTLCHTGGSPLAAMPTSAPIYGSQAGAGVAVNPGSQAGYAITTNTGGSYRVVWTGDASASRVYREFYGSIWTDGAFTSISPGGSTPACNCALEGNDFVSTTPQNVSGGQRIDFDTLATTGLDGVDFTIGGGATTAFFDVYIDGAYNASLVFFADVNSGGAQAAVSVVPFGMQIF